MRAHDGILILALLILAAAGCRKDDANDNAATGEAHRPTVALRGGRRAVESTPSTDGETTPASDSGVFTPEDEPETATSPEESVEKLSEAREELNELADGAVSLRAALLGADFRDANAPDRPAGEVSDERR